MNEAPFTALLSSLIVSESEEKKAEKVTELLLQFCHISCLLKKDTILQEEKCVLIRSQTAKVHQHTNALNKLPQSAGNAAHNLTQL